MAHLVKGFNLKEQKIFNKMIDGQEHDFRELKRLFVKDAQERCKQTYEPGWGEAEVDSQAQSYARNSIRRLIRDGWVEQTGRGTYSITTAGKHRVKKGVDITASFTESKRGKGRKTTKAKAKTTKAKTKTTKAKTTKDKTTKAKTTKAKTTKAKAKTTKARANGASTKKSNNTSKKVSMAKVAQMKAKTKVAAAKEKFAQANA